MTSNKRQAVREFVGRLLRENRSDDQPFSDTDSLWVSGRLTSLEAIELLSYLEGQFAFQADPNEFDLSMFDSIDQIMRLLESSGS
jgi:acyl carrier protein